MASSRSLVLKLYKSMLKEAREFQSYNFRAHALRRIRESFRDSKNVVDENAREEMIKYAQENLAIIKRQTTIGKLYASEPLIIETCAEAKTIVGKLFSADPLNAEQSVAAKQKT